MTRNGWALYAAGIGFMSALPIVSAALQGGGHERCDLDGVALPDLFRVRIEDAEGASRRFCSVLCAESWLAATAMLPRRVFVVDESTGNEIATANAWFVRSTVIVSPATGERLHAFARKEDAEAHVATYGGFVLHGAERPLEVNQ